MLNIKITGLETDRHLNALILGNPGSGKTLMASTFPNPFYASCEGGLLSVRKRKVPSHEVKKSSEMDEIIRLMRQSPEVREKQLGMPVDTLVIDTLDNFQKLIKREILAQSGKSAPTMQEWGILGEKMRSYVAAIRGLDMNVVVTCHLKRLQDEDTGKVSIVPLLEGGYRDEAPGDFDIVGILESKQRKVVVPGEKEAKTVTNRILRTVPDYSSDWLKDRSGVLPAEFDVNLTDDYDRMSELIFQDIEDMESIHDEIEQLQSKVDEATQTAAEVAEITPEPVADPEPTPVDEAKATSQVDTAVDTVSTEQFQQLTGPFNEIADDAERMAVKKRFVEEFGNPAILPVTRLAEATAWIQAEVAAQGGEEVSEPAATVVEEETTDEATLDEGVIESAREPVPCTHPRCPVKDIEDEDVIELSKMQNGNKALCPKHLREMKK